MKCWRGTLHILHRKPHYLSPRGTHRKNLRHRVGGGGAVNEGLPKFSDLQKMWGYKVF